MGMGRRYKDLVKLCWRQSIGISRRCKVVVEMGVIIDEPEARIHL